MVRAAWRERAGQATVEMAVVAPALIVLALISYNLMMFACAVARFDRVAPDIVLAHGVSPATPDGEMELSYVCETVKASLEEAMGSYRVDVNVTCERGGGEADSVLALVGELRTYTCRMEYRPWPAGVAIAGVSVGAPAALSHERTVAVDPWKPGVIL